LKKRGEEKRGRCSDTIKGKEISIRYNKVMKKGNQIKRAIEKIGKLGWFVEMIEKNIEAAGIEVIKRARGGELTSFLGSGAYQLAYEVIYKGKRAVLKVQIKNSGDVEITKRLWEIRKGLPEKFKGYIMEVYDVINIGGQLGIIVEYLEELDAGILGSIESTFNKGDKFGRLEVLKNNKGMMKAMIDGGIMDVLRRGNQLWRAMGEDKNYVKVLRNAILRKVEEVGVMDAFDFGRMVQIIKEIGEGMGDNWYKRLTLDISDEVGRNLMELVHKYAYEPLPAFGDSGIEHNETLVKAISKTEDEKLRGLVKFLNYLKHEKGIEWGDLHSKNIMQRPGTGELVISDPGYFGGTGVSIGTNWGTSSGSNSASGSNY